MGNSPKNCVGCQPTCCTSPKTACLIIAAAQMIISFLTLVYGFVVIGWTRIENRRLDPDTDTIYIESYGNYMIGGLVSAGGAILLVHSAILIHGIRKGRPGYLLCWMIIFGLIIVSAAIGVLTYFTIQMKEMKDFYETTDMWMWRANTEYETETTMSLLWVSVTIALGISAYLIVIVNSHRCQLLSSSEIKDEEDLNQLASGITKTASLIIGVAHLVMSILIFLVVFFFSLYFYTHYMYELNTLSWIPGFGLAVIAVLIAASAILIHGTRKGKSGYLLCWTIMFGICLGITSIGFLTYQSYQVAIAVQHDYIPQWVITQMIMTCVIVTVVVGFFSYQMWIVNSHRRELLSLSENMDAEGKTKPNQEVENKTYNKMYLKNVQ